nr:uncharacterized protein LOC107438328 isoform X2 [Parasteatoda tepidariorum]
MRKLFQIISLLMISGIFVSLECWCILLSDVIYDDIEILNGTCKGKDSCNIPRTKDTLEKYNCNCGISCSLLNTCCVDSKYRRRYTKPIEDVYCSQYKDEKQKNYFYPLISQCNPDLENDKTTEELCQSYGNDDPFLLIPVTDLITGITYKNYYCFACNEKYSREEPVPWNLVLESESEKVVRSSLPNLYYNKTRWSWFMEDGKENISVNLLTSLPEELKTVVPYCFNFRIISDCASDWTDDNIREKCLAYMALTRIPKNDDSYNYTEYYRNPHCAICNHQNLENMMCEGEDENYVLYFSKRDDFFVGLFYLRSEKCEDNMVYDNFAKKCRKIYRLKKKR